MTFKNATQRWAIQAWRVRREREQFVLGNSIRWRACRFLGGLGDCLDAISVAHYEIHAKKHPDGGATITTKVYRWHPAFWLAWFRCRVLGDFHGSAIYGQRIKWKLSVRLKAFFYGR